MREEISLNDLYENYTLGFLKKEVFESAIFETLREDLPRIYLPGWSKEDYEDYVSSLYPRISRSIDTYRPSGTTFDVYIKTVARLAAREYHSLSVQSYVEETVAWLAHAPDLYAHEKEFPYDEPIREAEDSVKTKNPRQLLVLILKCSSRISTEFLERAAPRLGMKPDELDTLITALKEQQHKRERNIKELREIANSQFSRCLFYEKRMQYLAEGSESARRNQRKLEQRREKLAKTRQRLARMNSDPSNRQIAQLLGVKKSTIDSTLYALKARGVNAEQVNTDQSTNNDSIALEENPSPLSE